MFSSSNILHDAIRSHDSLDLIKTIIQTHPQELAKRDPFTKMTVLEHANFRQRIDIVLLVSAKEKPLNFKFTSQHDGLLQIIAEHLTHTVREVDNDIYQGLLYWCAVHSTQPHLLDALISSDVPIKENLALKVDDKKTEKNPLLSNLSIDLDVKYEANFKKISQPSLFGLIELATQKKSGLIAARLIKHNQNQIRINSTMTTALQWAKLKEVREVAQILPQLKLINNSVRHEVSTLSIAQQKIYNQAQSGEIVSLENFYNKQKSKPDFNEKGVLYDYSSGVYLAYQNHDYVALQAFIEFFIKIEKIQYLFHLVTNEKNRSLFFILMFSTNIYSIDLVRHFSSQLNLFFKLLAIPAERKNIIYQIVSHGMSVKRVDVRPSELIEAHKDVFKQAVVTTNEWIEAYFKVILACPQQDVQLKKALVLKPSLLTEIDVINWLKNNNLYKKSIVTKLCDDARRFGISLIQPALMNFTTSNHSTRLIALRETIFAKTFQPSAEIAGFLDVKSRGRFAQVSHGFYSLTLSPTLVAVNEFLEHLNQCVLQYGFRRRWMDLPTEQKTYSLGYFVVISGLIASACVLGVSVEANKKLQINNPQCAKYFNYGCTSESYGVASECVDFCQATGDQFNAMFGSAFPMSTVGAWLLGALGYNFTRWRAGTHHTLQSVQIYQALFNDLSHKSIGVFSNELPIKARKLLSVLKDKTHQLTENSTVKEFRDTLSIVRRELMNHQKKPGLFALANRDLKDEKSDLDSRTLQISIHGNPI